MTEEEWQAIQNRDPSYDGRFFYVLKTTGKICRPSCNKKTPAAKNVLIFRTCEEAEAEGYQPCGRCRPDELAWKGIKAELAENAALLIRQHDTETFSLDKLADSLHINKYHLLRTFKEVTGKTLLQYHMECRCEKAKELLGKSDLAVADIAVAMGFHSTSDFSRVFRKTEGITPSVYRKRCGTKT